jgi:imidazolonepropionase-like amidohydrolase
MYILIVILRGHNNGKIMLLINANLATMDASPAYGLVAEGALAIEDGRIAWAGPMSGLPSRFRDLETLDLGGRLVTPALIDCHTHVVHGGNRAREFEMRLEGASYEGCRPGRRRYRLHGVGGRAPRRKPTRCSPAPSSASTR